MSNDQATFLGVDGTQHVFAFAPSGKAIAISRLGVSPPQIWTVGGWVEVGDATFEAIRDHFGVA